MLTRRSFWGRALRAAAGAVVAPALAALMPAARRYTAYELAKLEAFARMYSANTGRIAAVGSSPPGRAGYTLVTRRSTSKTTSFVSLARPTSFSVQRDSVSVHTPGGDQSQLVGVDYSDLEARTLACVARGHQ